MRGGDEKAGVVTRRGTRVLIKAIHVISCDRDGTDYFLKGGVYDDIPESRLKKVKAARLHNL